MGARGKWSTVLACAALFSTLGRCWEQSAPFKNEDCSEELTEATYLDMPTDKNDTSRWAIGVGEVVWFEQAEFVGAKFLDGSSAADVYWRIPRAPPNCRIIGLVAYTQYGYGFLPDGPQPPGNVIFNVHQAGCQFTSLQYQQNFGLTYCCGWEACALYATGNEALNTRDAGDESVTYNFNHKRRLAEQKDERYRRNPFKPRDDASELAEPLVGSRSAHEGHQHNDKGSVIASRIGQHGHQHRRQPTADDDSPKNQTTDNSLDFRDVQARSHPRSFPHRESTSYARHELSERDEQQPAEPDGFDQCTVAEVVGKPWSVAGRQTIVSQVQTCTGSQCNIAVEQKVNLKSSISSTESQTFKSTTGQAITFTKGSSYAGLQTSTKQYSSISKATSKSLGKTYAESQEATVKQTIGMKQGQSAFLSFTPMLVCTEVKLDCKSDQNPTASLVQCDPVYLGDGKTPQGDYNPVYTR